MQCEYDLSLIYSTHYAALITVVIPGFLTEKYTFITCDDKTTL